MGLQYYLPYPPTTCNILVKWILLVNFVQGEFKWKNHQTGAECQVDAGGVESARAKAGAWSWGGSLGTLSLSVVCRIPGKGFEFGESMTILFWPQRVAGSHPPSESHVTAPLSLYISYCHFHS